MGIGLVYEKENNMRIEYKDLSVPLKIAVVSSFVTGSIYLLYFIVGLISGIMEG